MYPWSSKQLCLGNRLKSHGQYQTVPRSVRAPEQILEDCKSDRVIVPDPSLRNLLVAARDGAGSRKIFTPEELLYTGDENWRMRILVFLTDRMSWRKATFLLEAAESCVLETGNLKQLNSVSDFSDDEIALIREAIRAENNPLYRMKKSSIEGEAVVVGKELMNTLQMSVLPDDYETVDLFGANSEMPEIQLFRSSGALSESVVNAVEEVGAENVGIIAPERSRLRKTVESRLDSRGLSYGPLRETEEVENVRTFISFLRVGLNVKEPRIRDVKPILDSLDLEYPRDSLRKIDSVEGLEKFRELLSMIPRLEISEILESYSELTDPGLAEETVAKLGIRSSKISEETLSRLEYAASNMVEQNSRGVSFVDPEKHLVSERPTVFVLGLDRSWNPDDREWPWSDPQSRAEYHRQKLELQLGVGNNMNICAVEEDSREISGCRQLHELLNQDFQRFSELKSRKVHVKRDAERQGFKLEEVEPANIDTGSFSQSELNSYALSPRLYYFSKLVSDETDVGRKKGTLFHDYAEFRVSHPSTVEEADEEEILQVMVNELKDYVDSSELRKIKTELRLGIRSIDSFLQSIEISRKRTPYKSRGSRNTFSKHFGKELRSESTELYFKDEELGVSGKIDFMPDPGRMIDFKSGRSRSAQKSFRKAHPEVFDRERFPDFQPLLYLTAHSKNYPDVEPTFSFFYFLKNMREAAMGRRDDSECRVSLKLYRDSFSQKASSKQFYDELVSGVAESNDRRKTLEKLGYDKYSEVAREISSSEFFDKKSAETSDFKKRLEQKAKEEVGDYSYVEKGVASAVRKLSVMRTTAFYSEDIEAMEEFLEQQLDAVQDNLENGFPIGDRKIDELPEKDLLLP